MYACQEERDLDEERRRNCYTNLYYLEHVVLHINQFLTQRSPDHNRVHKGSEFHFYFSVGGLGEAVDSESFSTLMRASVDL